MECNRDSSCLKLATVDYPNLQKKVNSQSLEVIASINKAIANLKSTSISNDYLGNKIDSSIDTVCKKLQDDIEKVKVETREINDFIEQKIIEHQEHFNSWVHGKGIEAGEEAMRRVMR